MSLLKVKFKKNIIKVFVSKSFRRLLSGFTVSLRYHRVMVEGFYSGRAVFVFHFLPLQFEVIRVGKS